MAQAHKAAIAALVLPAAMAVGFLGVGMPHRNGPSFRAQLCGIPDGWLERMQRGYLATRSGQIALLPRTPAYMASGAGGWTHSGPWEYLQAVPLTFYGPGIVPRGKESDRLVTTADVAPTIAALLRLAIPNTDGRPLRKAVGSGPRPRLIVTVVWDGGGWNTLDRWPSEWPNLTRAMREGANFTSATVGSSPSVTPAVHTTLGTGSLPWKHGITGVNVRAGAELVDPFLQGGSSHMIKLPTVAELWDEHVDGQALVGMLGYLPWHLGMIGAGAGRPGGDRDHAAWLDEDNSWITDEAHYRMPRAVLSTRGFRDDLERLDRADGAVDGNWGKRVALSEPADWELTPAFIVYQTRALLNLIDEEEYGRDRITDLLFVNFKQIDRVGHYFNMASEEVRQSIAETDRQLGVIFDFLDRDVGEGRWVAIVTADHGQQPDSSAVGGYGIDPNELRDDIIREFGPVVQRVWPTEIFLDDAAMEDRVDAEEVARFLGDYRLSDNSPSKTASEIASRGGLEPDTRLFAVAVPSRVLTGLGCAA